MLIQDEFPIKIGFFFLDLKLQPTCFDLNTTPRDALILIVHQ
jgi:hypothetical protein